jgi:hypothetical protein
MKNTLAIENDARVNPFRLTFLRRYRVPSGIPPLQRDEERRDGVHDR